MVSKAKSTASCRRGFFTQPPYAQHGLIPIGMNRFPEELGMLEARVPETALVQGLEAESVWELDVARAAAWAQIGGSPRQRAGKAKKRYESHQTPLTPNQPARPSPAQR
jgi:hypothetical protein